MSCDHDWQDTSLHNAENGLPIVRCAKCDLERDDGQDAARRSRLAYGLLWRCGTIGGPATASESMGAPVAAGAVRSRRPGPRHRRGAGAMAPAPGPGKTPGRSSASALPLLITDEIPERD